MLDPSLDWRVLAFTAATTVATAVLFGAAPALRATRVHPIEALKEPGRSAAGETGGHLSGGLIVAQVALSLVLVMVAGLFVATFERLAHVPLGLDRDRVLMVTVTAPTIPGTERNVFYHRLVRAVASLPGVAAAGGSFNPPIVGTLRGDLVVSERGTEPSPDAERISQGAEVRSGWFAAYGMPIRAGRDFDDRDTLASRRVMIVNEAFVRRFLPDQSPIDKPFAVTYRMAPVGDYPLGTKTIVGVVGDFAGLALLLAALGLYGVTSYAVARRRMEIGIRAALGAAPIDIIRLVLLRVALLVGMGVVIGAGLSLWTSGFVASLLYGVQPRDPWTLIGAAVTLATVGALAGWLPAWRASRLEPANVLRES